MTRLPVHRHKKSACCLALATANCPVSLDAQRSTILLLPPMPSNDAHNPTAWLPSPRPLEFLRFFHVFYSGLGCQVRHQAFRWPVVWNLLLATRSPVLRVGQQDAHENWYVHTPPRCRLRTQRAPRADAIEWGPTPDGIHELTLSSDGTYVWHCLRVWLASQILCASLHPPFVARHSLGLTLKPGSQEGGRQVTQGT